MARLDQDAAGRLLERTGDRAPREMTVRIGSERFGTPLGPTEPGLQAGAQLGSRQSLRCHTTAPEARRVAKRMTRDSDEAGLE